MGIDSVFEKSQDLNRHTSSQVSLGSNTEKRHSKTRLPPSIPHKTGDSFALSELAYEFFTQLESAYSELLTDYPEYKRYFQETQKTESLSKGPSLLYKAKEFLNTYQSLSQSDSDFKRFYGHVEELNQYAQEAFEHLQTTQRKTLQKIYKP